MKWRSQLYIFFWSTISLVFIIILQIGLRGEALLELNEEALIEVIDLTEFVTEQRPHASGGDYCELITPKESVYSTQSGIVS